MTGGDLEFLGELIDTFYADGSDLLAAIGEAASSGDAPGVAPGGAHAQVQCAGRLVR